MTETTLPTIRPIVLDEYPVNEEDGSINVYVYAGDEVATVVLSDKHSTYDQDEAQAELDAQGDGDTAAPLTTIDTYWNEDDLYELAMTAARALRATGKTKVLAALMTGVAEELQASL